ncbi:MAG: hypothetical protein JW915_22430 [Chitinispirillaceae bacterium]|nr:hypothetical protein [Chitinispirillaceae bacterium]
MRKSHLILTPLFLSTAMLLYCALPKLNDPENTSMTVVFKTADSMVHAGTGLKM